MRPDLNKLRFLKLHRKKRIIRVNKGVKGKRLSNYSFGMFTNESKIITSNQMEAVRKLIVRKLKGKSNKNQKNLKIIKSQAKVNRKQKRKRATAISFNLRHNFCLGLTKKPLQVRMGKGKGSPVDWVYPCASSRVLVEFSLAKIKMKKVKKILIKAGEKLPCAIKFNRVSAGLKIKKYVKFSNNKVKCIREL